MEGALVDGRGGRLVHAWGGVLAMLVVLLRLALLLLLAVLGLLLPILRLLLLVVALVGLILLLLVVLLAVLLALLLIWLLVRHAGSLLYQLSTRGRGEINGEGSRTTSTAIALLYCLKMLKVLRVRQEVQLPRVV